MGPVTNMRYVSHPHPHQASKVRLIFRSNSPPPRPLVHHLQYRLMMMVVIGGWWLKNALVMVMMVMVDNCGCTPNCELWVQNSSSISSQFRVSVHRDTFLLPLIFFLFLLLHHSNIFLLQIFSSFSFSSASKHFPPFPFLFFFSSAKSNSRNWKQNSHSLLCLPGTDFD